MFLDEADIVRDAADYLRNLEKPTKVRFRAALPSLPKRVSNAVVDWAYRKNMKKMVELGLVRVKGSGRWRTLEVAK